MALETAGWLVCKEVGIEIDLAAEEAVGVAAIPVESAWAA